MIVVHECGHTFAAWMMGDWHATFVIQRRAVLPSGNVDTCTGCNLYNSASMGALANAFVNMAGVGATAVATWAAIAFLRFRPGWLRPPRWLLVEVAVVCWLGDMVWQVVQALPLGVPQNEPVGWGVGYTDFSAAGSFFARATGWPRPVAEAMGLAGVAVYSVVTAVAGLYAWRSVGTQGEQLAALSPL
ncbi:MAG TPA: hypothetical protein VFN61_00630 [Acidimicrobiales bacterium]|nr:hypothetical protein [Acidimicrobiales bacterium]